MPRSALISVPGSPKAHPGREPARAPQPGVPLVGGGGAAIREYPDPVLARPCEPLEPGGLAAQTVVQALTTAWNSGMLGLAAPQLGYSYRAIAVAAGDSFRIFLNPRIVRRSPTLVRGPESCLSLPFVTAEVDRAEAVIVRAIDTEGGEMEFPVQGRWAAVFQHEIDHLDGILFIDRLSAKDRRAALRDAASRRRAAQPRRIVVPGEVGPR